jgi:hypothetical protein
MKYLLYVAILIVALGLLAGIDLTSSTTSSKTLDLTYYKDTSTNLCFAKVVSYSAGGRSIASITCVPCDSVKHLLK